MEFHYSTAINGFLLNLLVELCVNICHKCAGEPPHGRTRESLHVHSVKQLMNFHVTHLHVQIYNVCALYAFLCYVAFFGDTVLIAHTTDMGRLGSTPMSVLCIQLCDCQVYLFCIIIFSKEHIILVVKS